MGKWEETIHNWVFKVRLGVNHTIKNGFGIIGKIYSVFQSAEVQKLWVLGKRQEAKGKGEEKQVYLTSLGNAIDCNLCWLMLKYIFVLL